MIRNRRAQTKGVFMVLLGGAISVSIFALLIVYSFRGAQESYSNVAFNESQFQVFDETNQIVNLTDEMNSAFTRANSSGTNVGDIINVATTGGYNTIQIFGALPDVYGGMMYDIADFFKVDRSIVTLLTMIVIAAVIALFILLVFRVYVQ